MKVLQLSSTHTWRGGEQQLAYLAETLHQQGISAPIVCPEKSALAAYAQKRKLDVLCYRKPFGKWSAIAQLASICRKARPDLIHLHDSHAHTIAWLAHVVRLINTPLIVSRRVDFPVGNHLLSRKKYNHPAIRKIICVSHAIRKIISPAIREKEKLCVIHDGLDFSRFENSKKTGKFKKELGLPDEAFLIGNVAALAPHKDYPTFVRTAILLLKKGYPFHFAIVGADGGCQTQVEQLIKNSGFSQRFHLTGFRQDIPEILPDLDLFLFTSKTEGLGSSLLDALYCKVPVVATAAGGIPEIIRHEKNGLLCPVGDVKSIAAAVERLFSEPSLRNRLIFEGKKQVQAFSVEAMAAQTAEAYTTALKNSQKIA